MQGKDVLCYDNHLNNMRISQLCKNIY